eukprot:COSAG01_NODE_4286_length_5174_cov_3.830542_6_plen_216_part_00
MHHCVAILPPSAPTRRLVAHLLSLVICAVSIAQVHAAPAQARRSAGDVRASAAGACVRARAGCGAAFGACSWWGVALTSTRTRRRCASSSNASHARRTYVKLRPRPRWAATPLFCGGCGGSSLSTPAFEDEGSCEHLSTAAATEAGCCSARCNAPRTTCAHRGGPGHCAAVVKAQMLPRRSLVRLAQRKAFVSVLWRCGDIQLATERHDWASRLC